MMVTWPDELEALLAAGGGVWDDYGVKEFASFWICVGFEPAFYFYYFFYVIFGHYEHVEDC